MELKGGPQKNKNIKDRKALNVSFHGLGQGMNKGLCVPSLKI